MPLLSSGETDGIPAWESLGGCAPTGALLGRCALRRNASAAARPCTRDSAHRSQTCMIMQHGCYLDSMRLAAFADPTRIPPLLSFLHKFGLQEKHCSRALVDYMVPYESSKFVCISEPELYQDCRVFD